MIQDLLGRHAFAIDYDTHDAGVWAGLFADEGTLKMPMMEVVVRGRDKPREFPAGPHRTLPGLRRVMTSPPVEVDGDRATDRAGRAGARCLVPSGLRVPRQGAGGACRAGRGALRSVSASCPAGPPPPG